MIRTVPLLNILLRGTCKSINNWLFVIPRGIIGINYCEFVNAVACLRQQFV
ncbi:hypothetical protein V2J09_019826 [Rumex salicifolius]